MTGAQTQEILARLQRLLPDESSTELLTQLIGDAEAEILAYTGRTAVPDGLLRTVGDLAVVNYNRLGTQGESARSEGGESYTFETMPARITAALNRFRLARTGGVYHEQKKSETVET
jgi:hypothetical protein